MCCCQHFRPARHPTRKDLAVRVLLAVAATTAALTVAVPASAAPSTTAVINEAYGGGRQRRPAARRERRRTVACRRRSIRSGRALLRGDSAAPDTRDAYLTCLDSAAARRARSRSVGLM